MKSCWSDGWTDKIDSYAAKKSGVLVLTNLDKGNSMVEAKPGARGQGPGARGEGPGVSGGLSKDRLAISSDTTVDSHPHYTWEQALSLSIVFSGSEYKSVI